MVRYSNIYKIIIKENLKIVFQENWLSYPCDCNFKFLTRYRKERLVARIVSQGVAAFAPPYGESGFGLMATDDIKPLKLGGSRPLLDDSIRVEIICAFEAIKQRAHVK